MSYIHFLTNLVIFFLEPSTSTIITIWRRPPDTEDYYSAGPEAWGTTRLTTLRPRPRIMRMLPPPTKTGRQRRRRSPWSTRRPHHPTLTDHTHPFLVSTYVLIVQFPFLLDHLICRSSVIDTESKILWARIAKIPIIRSVVRSL